MKFVLQKLTVANFSVYQPEALDLLRSAGDKHILQTSFDKLRWLSDISLDLSDVRVELAVSAPDSGMVVLPPGALLGVAAVYPANTRSTMNATDKLPGLRRAATRNPLHGFVCVHHAFRHRGIGQALVRWQNSFTNYRALVSTHNAASIKLMFACGMIARRAVDGGATPGCTLEFTHPNSTVEV